ncbi:MAG: Eco57I restriction-modification methylase domain-containing protein [Acetobacteraceae bacterium]|nr:Eco57I restriction-modification methylase domain-containing protein [Acetobacteraceae bacterium]
MADDYIPLLSDTYLRSRFGSEADDFRGSADDIALVARLRDWANRGRQTETQAEAGFLRTFFFDLWGYWPGGAAGPERGFTAYPRHPIPGAGGGGNTGFADLALGWFDAPPTMPVPQVICEFKDIRSSLDAPQARRGNRRSPVQQCADYLRGAELPLFAGAPIRPRFGIVSDMNEVRVYWRDKMPAQSLRFVIRRPPGVPGTALLDDTPAGAFQRFLFARLLHRDMLLSRIGEPPLLRLIREQLVRERDLEREFYAEYRRYREALIHALIEANPAYPHTRGRLVRLAQKLLDRMIFVLFCEDMGQQIAYPPQLLRNRLVRLSTEALHPAGGEGWEMLRRLFRRMDTGGPFDGQPLNRFNGGLFATDPELDELELPNHAFFFPGQGGDEASLRSPQPNLLYFAANYNFGTTADGRAITLYALGRIFEQSITELEALEAAQDGRPSLTVITRRKRDGVYYTPEWVVAQVVEETLGTRLESLRQEAGWDEATRFTEDQIARRTSPVRAQVQAIERYQAALRLLTVVDPACGSGAFLIYALDYLLLEVRRTEAERQRLAGDQALLFDDDAATKEILSRNIYGVDINPASVELTRLALWLHTARAGSALSDLDHTIRDGNSLVGPDIANINQNYAELLPSGRERINAFDWQGAFPEVFARGGFDCVIGNPPYVKLQNYRRVMPEVADYLRRATAPGLQTAGPRYASAQTGNTDLYLPFIEKGIDLLRPGGRLGFIAPSLWLLNEYGRGLRRRVHRGRHLDRWIDFKDFQVFDEAITYTALQFFTREPNAAVRFQEAPTGPVVPDWSDPDRTVPYEGLAAGEAWTLLPRAERAVMTALEARCDRLDGVASIIVGLQTSADSIYHLRLRAPGRYEAHDGTAVPIEDAIMLPLVSGPDVRRWEVPRPEWHILFPYAPDEAGRMRLIPAARMASDFPLAWAYLARHEAALRAREDGKMDDAVSWWAYNYPKNLDKQDRPKLFVAQTVKELEVAPDASGVLAANNVRVNCILPTRAEDLWFLLAVLHGGVCDWVFRCIAKPKMGGFFEANRQFIAPLPVPRADSQTRAALARGARVATALHTRRAAALHRLEHRFAACAVQTEPIEWLLAGQVMPLDALRRSAPPTLARRETQAWAMARQAEQTQAAIARMAGLLPPDANLTVAFEGGELRLNANGMPLLDRIFLDAADGPFIALQWRLALRGRNFVGMAGAEALLRRLPSVRRSANPDLRAQAIGAGERVLRYDAAIALNALRMETALEAAYGLTPDERVVISQTRPLS